MIIALCLIGIVVGLVALDRPRGPAIYEPEPNLGPSTHRVLSTQEAWELAESGEWVTWAGYCWRNNGKWGEYMAYGEYPDCIRACDKFERDAFDKPNAQWRLYIPEIRPARDSASASNH